MPDGLGMSKFAKNDTKQRVREIQMFNEQNKMLIQTVGENIVLSQRVIALETETNRLRQSQLQ
jgi:BMFP domain-containing protein YqiC